MIGAIAERGSQIAEQNIAEMANAIEALLRGMEGAWKRNQGKHSALNAEILAEAARNKRVSKLIRRRNDRIRGLLVDLLEDARKKGEVEADLDPVGTASLLISLTDGLTAARDAHTGINYKRAIAATRRFLERSLRPDKRIA